MNLTSIFQKRYLCQSRHLIANSNKLLGMNQHISDYKSSLILLEIFQSVFLTFSEGPNFPEDNNKIEAAVELTRKNEAQV